MKFTELPLPGAYAIDLEQRGDSRGRFTRLFCAKEIAAIAHTKPIVNVNLSYTQKRGTIRGMHFQNEPHAEVKIIKCIRGAILDVIVDNRKDSPTYLKWTGLELTESNDLMIYIPEGFAHGFQSLSDDVEMIYFHTEYYEKASEGGLGFDDPKIGIVWPLPPTVISERDRSFQFL